MFSNLTEEQQEIIAGGNSGLPINNFQNLGGLRNQGALGKKNSPSSSTDFLAEVRNLNTLSSSGPNGSVTGGSSNVQVVKTSGFNSIGSII